MNDLLRCIQLGFDVLYVLTQLSGECLQLFRARLASRKRPVKWVPCLIWFLPAKVGMVGYGDGVEYGYSCGDYR